MKNRWLLMGLIVVGLGSVGSWTHAETTTNEDGEADEPQWTEDQLTIIHERGVKLLQRTAHGRFVLTGEVVDQSGARLKDVKLNVVMTTLVGWGWETKDTGRSEVVRDGRFQIDVRPYNAVTLYFEKEGYYPEKRFFDFDAAHPAEIEQAIMRGEDVQVKEGVVRHENIRVLMEKIGNITKLIRYKGPLEYVSSYGGRTAEVAVIDFADPPLPDYKLKHVPAATAAESLPASCIYTLADTDGEGRVLTDDRVSGQYGQHKHQIPKRVRVIMCDPDGGFVEYVPKEKTFARRFMKQAPAEGYQRELIVDVDKVMDRIKTVEGTYNGIYFYFKAGGKYGKGVISSSTVDTSNRLRIGGKYELQPDGSRNVDTGREH